MIKKYWYILPISLLLMVVGYQAANPRIETQTVYLTRVEYKERLVYQKANRTVTRKVSVTKPDGTKIVSETQANTKVISSVSDKYINKEERREETKSSTRIASYGLGVSVNPLDPRDVTRVSVGFDVRLGESPLWITLDAVPMKREFSLGLRFEF